jgi:hypothetical protein
VAFAAVSLWACSGETSKKMKHILRTVLAIISFTACLFAQDSFQQPAYERWEIGVFADAFRLSRVKPRVNFSGVGARAGYYFGRRFALEAELSYDFERRFNTVYTNGFTNLNVNTPVHVLHGLGGPRFDLTTGRVRLFGVFKAGFVQFGPFTENPGPGFTNTIGEVTANETRFAMYPAAGVEAVFGRFGLRLDVGDDLYFSKGKHSNIKASFGPTFRF